MVQKKQELLQTSGDGGGSRSLLLPLSKCTSLPTFLLLGCTCSPYTQEPPTARRLQSIQRPTQGGATCALRLGLLSSPYPCPCRWRRRRCRAHPRSRRRSSTREVHRAPGASEGLHRAERRIERPVRGHDASGRGGARHGVRTGLLGGAVRLCVAPAAQQLRAGAQQLRAPRVTIHPDGAARRVEPIHRERSKRGTRCKAWRHLDVSEQ